MGAWIYVHDLDPVIAHLGPLRIGWYGMMYAVSFICGYYLLTRTAKKYGPVAEQDVSSLATYLILGVVLGARIGWVIFYGGMPYLINPLRIFETWKGGMSFHGGMLAVLFAMWLFSRRYKVPLIPLGDFVLPVCPLGLFFGRMGNFINGELYGKPTDGTWGVIFPGDPQHLPRHPSQLYEGVLEGLVIFAVLQLLQRYVRRPGLPPATFLFLYGIARIGVEFVRLPDRDIGYLFWGFVTMGQVLSFPMALFGLGWILYIFFGPPSRAAKRA